MSSKYLDWIQLLLERSLNFPLLLISMVNLLFIPSCIAVKSFFSSFWIDFIPSWFLFMSSSVNLSFQDAISSANRSCTAFSWEIKHSNFFLKYSLLIHLMMTNIKITVSLWDQKYNVLQVHMNLKSMQSSSIYLEELTDILNVL